MKRISLALLTLGLAFAQGSNIFTATSGTTCTVTSDPANKVVNVACAVTPNIPATVISFNPHSLEGAAGNTLYFSWGGVSMIFSKPLATSNLTYSYGILSTTGIIIQTPINGSVAIGF